MDDNAAEKEKMEEENSKEDLEKLRDNWKMISTLGRASNAAKDTQVPMNSKNTSMNMRILHLPMEC